MLELPEILILFAFMFAHFTLKANPKKGSDKIGHVSLIIRGATSLRRMVPLLQKKCEAMRTIAVS